MNSTERELFVKYGYKKPHIYMVYEEFELRVNNTLEEYDGLRRGECRFDYYSWEKRLGLSHWQMNNAIKILIKDEFIEQRIKGKKGTQSTYFLTRFNLEFDQQKNKQNYKQKEQQNKSSNINGLEEFDQQKEQQKNKQETVQSSIHNNLNIISNNIYSPLDSETYVNEINKNLEKDLLNKIKSKYSKKLIKEELEKIKDKGFSELNLLIELEKSLSIRNKDIKEKKRKNIKSIFDYWNSKEIIKHKKLTPVIEKAIQKSLDIYSEEEIRQAINLYGEILKSAFYFSYKWNLSDFLNRKNGISTFMGEGSNKANYEAWKKGESKNKFINNTKIRESKNIKLRGWEEGELAIDKKPLQNVEGKYIELTDNKLPWE